MAEELNLQDPDWLAEQLGIEKNTIYKFLGDGTIPALRLGKKWLVDPEDVRAFMATERRRQTVGRRAEAWLLSEIFRLTRSARLSGTNAVTPDLLADTVRAIEHQIREQAYAYMYIPDVDLLMRQAGLRLVPCDRCHSHPVINADDEGLEPLCEDCTNEALKRWEALEEKGGGYPAEFTQ